MEIAGDRPSIKSTSGFPSTVEIARMRDSDSTWRRWPASVSKASEDFPDGQPGDDD
jgi:hypothetical protein